MAPTTLDVKVEFGFPVLAADKENVQTAGYIRIKPSDSAVSMPNHVILILDLSLSMNKNLSSLRESIEIIVNRLTPYYDKCTIIGFSGDTKEFCRFTSVKALQDDLSDYVPKPLNVVSGTTNFKNGLEKAIRTIDELKIDFSGVPPKGNETFEWNSHNHVAIFMTDGRDYGNVPWNVSQSLAERGVTLHTIALNSTEINADVRRKLMKMAKIGGGGFNFCKTVGQFHSKVDQLLNMSLGAVCPPTKFSIWVKEGVEFTMLTLLEHVEQKIEDGGGLELPVFTLPALRPDDRKIIYFQAKVGPSHSPGEIVCLFEYEQEPNLLAEPDQVSAEIAVVPFEAFKKAASRGLNADMRVFILLHNLESELEIALEQATSVNDISGFKGKATSALQNCKLKLDSQLSRNPRRDEVGEFIERFLIALEDADTVEDPSVFFSTLYAEMRTRR